MSEEDIKAALRLEYIRPSVHHYYDGYKSNQNAEIRLMWNDEVLDSIQIDLDEDDVYPVKCNR